MTPTTLADGRELIYFDDTEPYVSGGATRTLTDARPLPDRFAPVPDADGVPQPVTGPELRRDPLTGEWIPMAAHRMNRTFLPPADANPLAPAKPGAVYQDGEIPAEDYDVVVFENRFPSLLAVPGRPGRPVQRDGEPLWTVRPAAGRCEVICFSADSTASLSTVTPRRMRTIVEAWAQRTAGARARCPASSRCSCSRTAARRSASRCTTRTARSTRSRTSRRGRPAMLAQARAHHEPDGPPAGPRRAGRRAGARRADRAGVGALGGLRAVRGALAGRGAPGARAATSPTCRRSTDDERDDLATVYLALLQRLDRFFVGPEGEAIPLPYISGWHQAPIREGRDVSRLHLQLFSVLRAPGKLKYLAGVESGMGAWISDTTPERIATRLQELA